MWLHGYADNRQSSALWHVLIINASGKSCGWFIFRSAYFLLDESVIVIFAYSVVIQRGKWKVGIIDSYRQPSVCKSTAQRKSLWNTGIWKNEHNRQNGRTMQTRTSRRWLISLNAHGKSCGWFIPRSAHFLPDESVIGIFTYSVVIQRGKWKVGITDRRRQPSVC